MASHHVKHKGAKAPQVGRLAVAAVNDNFGGHVLQGAAEGARGGVGPLELLAHAKVREDNVPGVVEHNVLWLEVAVHNVAAVEVLEGQRDLRRIKAGLWVQEDRLAAEHAVQLTATQERHHQVQAVVGLEGVLEADNKR